MQGFPNVLDRTAAGNRFVCQPFGHRRVDTFLWIFGWCLQRRSIVPVQRRLVLVRSGLRGIRDYKAVFLRNCRRQACRYSCRLCRTKTSRRQLGEKITRGQNLNVPDQPVIPFIRGDGTGPDLGRGCEGLT
jgi:hypothetical protein